MFADPQSITVNAVAQSLPAVARNDNASRYRKDDGTYVFSVSHQYAKRNRFSVRIDGQKVAADPLAAGINVVATMSTYLVIDAPPTGYTNAELKDIALALSAWCTSANLLKVLGGET